MRSLAAAALPVIALVAAGSTAPSAQVDPQRDVRIQETRPEDLPDPLAEEPPIFRLGVSLVQLDAVVTDRQGQHVTTLRPEDFEVYQNGRRQPVTAVSYVDATERWEDLSGLPPLQATRQVHDARHVLAIVVDDRRMSFEGIARVRRSLETFIGRQFRSGEIAGMVMTTGGRDRFPHDLTYSPSVLTAAVRRLQYAPWGAAGVGDDTDMDLMPPPMDLEQMYERGNAVTAIDRITDAVDLLGQLPGRKSVILVSEGFSLYGGTLENGPIREALQRLADKSNRAAVVLYAIDPRGLMAPRHLGPERPSLDRRRDIEAMVRETQWDLQLVSAQTGGFAVVNSNDLVGGFERIVADQRGYYLIGYQPDAGTIDESASEFRRIKIKVRRKGLSIRTRAGFYGVSTE
ncbi:MAG: VWA domain-containing protein [Vicinamibacterales bacterium]